MEEQRAFIKISILYGKSSTEIYKNLQEACGTIALSGTRVFDWARQFKSGRSTITDNTRSGRPATATDEIYVNSVSVLIAEDPRQTCEQIAYTLGISHTSVHQILTEHLGKRKVAAKYVPHDLTVEQKQNRVNLSRSLLSRYFHEGMHFLHRIVAVDETWVHCYEPELKRQSSEWRSPEEGRPIKFRQGASTLKQMMIFGYTTQRILIGDRVPPGSSVNKEYYCGFLSRLSSAISRKQPDLLATGPLLLQDNAAFHTAALVMQRLEKYEWEVLPHAPYSPDKSPPDFDLFPILKETLRGKRYHNLEELSTAVNERVRVFEKDGLCRGIEKLPDRWQAIIDKDGDYIEH